MIDLAFKDGDLYIDNGELSFLEKSEALIEELKVFLNIRCCHKNNEGIILQVGELEYDQEQGIDFIYLFSDEITAGQIRAHYISKILTYYGEYITKILSIDVSLDKTSREIGVYFTYKTVWSKDIQTFKLVT